MNNDSEMMELLSKCMLSLLYLVNYIQERVHLLTEEEIDIRSFCPEDRVDLEIYPKTNRTIESLNEDEANALMRFSKSQFSSLLVHWKLDDNFLGLVTRGG
eukprot:6027304-Ditylum_brightwellii.AAC.1